ncbi:pentapeptide repeat-containing protein [Pseudoalteromonas rubra]|uniref:Pentapeptide repeat-containing protein n=1 Tax=Pseudoalteromonas rubra TaxID=43658 RepID=A0A5S3WZL6_9GAMM|nr:pentapeptide repeat-containing protein [Pseudoalteromonas rubra]TMP37372.1 hypothetical protein CWB98_11635 [Pseudoalteromonas rubra]
MEKELEREQMSQADKVTKLEGDDAILLWLKGKDAWNNWMKDNPGAEVSFEGVDFDYAALKKRFPNNKDLEVLIAKQPVEQPIFSFEGYKFSGVADFGKATFRGTAYFREATFVLDVCFRDASFSKKVDFRSAIFCKPVDFEGATFDDDASFSYSVFNSIVNFREVAFNGNANFGCATFNCGALFRKVTFGSKVSFLATNISEVLEFTSSLFESSFEFSPAKAEKITVLDFTGASFEKLFILSGYYKCIPDLRQTKTIHHIDLSQFIIKPKRGLVIGLGYTKYFISDDVERLCRLKEIASSNKDHKRMLAFNADELRHSRWIEGNPLKYILNLLYSITSNYGQSVFRPMLLLILSIIMFAHFTFIEAKLLKSELSTEVIEIPLEQNSASLVGRHLDEKAALTVSIATVAPFISISKGARERALTELFGDKLPSSYDLYSYLHAFMSFIFIFLIGLGLRNRFRI